MKRTLHYLLICLSGLVLTACNRSSPDYSVDVVRTEYGIPHIKADNWGDAGYGLGYAYAQDNFCVLMRSVVEANGQSMRYLGDDGDLSADVVFSYYNRDELVQSEWIDPQPGYFKELLAGYVAGVNRYLKVTGVGNLAEGEAGCARADWVRSITILDIGKVLHRKILRASTDPLSGFIGSVQPPSPMITAAPSRQQTMKQLSAIAPQHLADAMNMPQTTEIGSNAYGIGANASQSESGVLLGNPHFPWHGENRFYMFHLNVENEYNVFGAALHGFPVANIGFNANVAWSHTVSTGNRFTFYELTLNPNNAFQYDYDGEWRDIETVNVDVDVIDDSGAVVTEQHQLYLSHYGPIVNLGGLSSLLGGWPNALGTLVAMRDANIDNNRGMQQWTEMGQASDMDTFQQALSRIGIPWVNTIASSRQGDAFYGDISVVPHISEAKQNSCVRGLLAGLLTDAGFPTLDGSDSACEWGSDEGTASGVFGYDSLPKMQSRDYVANANDSYWLSNPSQLLEGFPPIIGGEGIEQTLRTRQTFIQAEQRIAGTDGLGTPGFSTQNMREVMFGNRNIAAELILADLVTSCQGVVDWSTYSSNASDVDQACDLLASWDGRFELDRVGPHIFTEFWRVARDLSQLWAVPFDAVDPINTPNTLNIAGAESDILQALASGVDALVAASIPMDGAWGDIQFDERNGVRIPIHGGSSSFMFSITTSDLIPGEGYSDIEHGNSYMQVVSWDQSDCPDAYALLSYSQSTDPASAHYADQTRLYSAKTWVDIPYCDRDIEAATISTEHIRGD